MGKWRDAFYLSLGPDADYDVDAPLIFGPPATDDQISAVEAALGYQLPDDFRSLLREFNGVKVAWDWDTVPYFLSTDEIPAASEFYVDWESELDLKVCRNVAFICVENGMADMWGIVVKPFGPYETGAIVGLDHDRVGCVAELGELFVEVYGSLLELVECQRKTVWIDE
jgi:hypothetical protein